MKNNIIAILTYCNTEEKISALIDNINLIRNKYIDFDIAIHANYPLPEYIQKLVDIYIYEDLNVNSKKNSIVWRILPNFNKKFIYNQNDEFGYSVFLQIKSLAFHLLKYKKVLLMNYDLIINKYYIDNHLNLDYDLIYYGKEDVCFLLVMSFDPNVILNKILNLINYDEYLQSDLIPEKIFYNYIEKSDINSIQIDYNVEDKISGMPYAASIKNNFFDENLICFNDNKLEIYLWFLKLDINEIKIRIDNNDFLLINNNNNGAFETYLNYYTEISNINIIEIDGVIVDIPLNIVKNSKTEDIPMNLKLVHILNKLDGERETKSIESLSKLKNYGVNYTQQLTPLYEGEDYKLPTESGIVHQGKGHYGLYLNYKKAIKENFSEDLDALIICECDCVLNIPYEIFIDEIKKTLDFCNKYNVYQFSWGDRKIDDIEQSDIFNVDINYPNYCVVNKIIQSHFIILTKQSRNFYLNTIEKIKWDAADIWLNELIYSEFSEPGRQATVFNNFAYQCNGISLLDNVMKGEKKHYYETIEGWFDFESIYSEAVNKFDDALFVEIGSWLGKSTSYMGVEILNSKKNIKFDCIDTWEGSKGYEDEEVYNDIIKKFKNSSIYQEFLKNIEPVKDYINPIKNYSYNVVNNYKDNSIDFLFIDGAHDYESVKKDIEDWFPKVKNTGMICGHDYVSNTPGVIKAVNEFFGEKNIKIVGFSWVVDKNFYKEKAQKLDMKNKFYIHNTTDLVDLNKDSEIIKKSWSDRFNSKYPESVTYHEIYNRQDYFKGDCIISPGDVVVDCGGNIGIFSSLAIDMGASRVLSFEPFVDNFELNKKNNPNVQVFDIAVSNKSDEILELLYSPAGNGCHTIISSEFDRAPGDFEHKNLLVKTITLDDIISRNFIEHIDFLKVDTEGSEIAIFDGLSDYNLIKIKNIALEYHSAVFNYDDDLYNNFQKRFLNLGFNIFTWILDDNTRMTYISKGDVFKENINHNN